MTDASYPVHPIGRVESPLGDLDLAPKQGDEGAPDAWLVFNPDVRDGLKGLTVGSDVIVLTWLDRAARNVLLVHPRGDPHRPEAGVFGTRSPARPNPIGLHRVHILAIVDLRLRVTNMEAIHGTPIIDVKPVLGPSTER